MSVGLFTRPIKAQMATCSIIIICGMKVQDCKAQYPKLMHQPPVESRWLCIDQPTSKPFAEDILQQELKFTCEQIHVF